MTFSRNLAVDMLNNLVNKGTTGLENSGANGLWVGLSTTIPTEAGGTINEPSGGGYSRRQIVPADWTGATATDPSRIANALDVAFPQASGNWGTLVSACLFKASTGTATFLGAGTINGGNGLTIDSGDTAEFKAGDLAVTLT